MSKKIYNVGMIGFGFMGKTHVFGYNTIPFYYGKSPIDVNFKVVCCNSESSANVAVNTYGFECGTVDIDDFFENYDLDIIHICTPNLLHKENILRALKKGTHIYCEKPLTVSGEDANDILKACEGNDSIFHMVFNNRFFTSTLRAKEIIDSGKLGNLVNVRARCLLASHIGQNAPVNWRRSGPDQGGVLLDLGSHIIDLVHYLVGEIDSIYGMTHLLYPERENANGDMVKITQSDGFSAIGKMKNGAHLMLEASKIVAGANNDMVVELNFEKGSLKLDLEDPNWLYFYDDSDEGGAYGGNKGYKQIECIQRYPERTFPSEKHSLDWLRGHVHCLYTFLKCVQENKKSQCDFNAGAYVHSVTDAILQSETCGTLVKIKNVEGNHEDEI